MPLDRSRLPPDVARRLVALAPHLGEDGAAPVRDASAPAARHALPAAGREVPAVAGAGPVGDASVARDGWTPRPPARGDAPAAPPAPGPSVDRTPASDDGPPDGTPLQVPPHGSPAPPEERPWRPSVPAALATAAASLPAPPHAPVRWAPGWRAAGTAVLVLALAAGAVVLRAAAAPRGEPVALPTPAVTAPAAAVEGAAPGPDRVVVHVVGAVAQPGVVQLDLGARVADAIAAAGGSSPEADLTTVNLARVLTDGEQLVVTVVGAPVAPAALAAPGAPAPADGLVDLNTAPATALEELPGVGPVLAGRIVERRTERPFTTVDELDDVTGIGPALLADLRPRVRV